MSNEFSAALATGALAERAAHLAPGNPFHTAAYLKSQTLLGEEAWVFTVTEPTGTEWICFGYMRAGRLNRVLRIPSVPVLPSDSPFWGGLDAFCRTSHVTQLDIAMMGSAGVTIPPWRGETERIARTEFVLDLQPADLLAKMSRGHRTWIKKGRKHGLTVHRGHSEALIDAHVRLHLNSMDRRRNRGESVPSAFPRRIPTALLQTGAGEVYQATLGDSVLSSLLVIRSATGAYSESAGNSQEGMVIGASHLLAYEAALALKAEGIQLFYMGGTREHEVGLRIYKERFGTTPLPMESIQAYVGKPWRRKLTMAAALVHR